MVFLAFVDWSHPGNLQADRTFQFLLQLLDLMLQERLQVIVVLLHCPQNRTDLLLLGTDLMVGCLQHDLLVPDLLVGHLQ